MRRTVSRLLLVALALGVVAAVGRLTLGEPRGDAAVSITGLEPDALRHEAFELTAPARMAIDAVGSFEQTDAPVLAAVGWIVRRADGAVVWRQAPGARPARGFLAAHRDTLALAPGVYDAYLSTYGDPDLRRAPSANGSLGARLRAALSRGGRAWHGEAGRWRLVVTGVTAADRAAARPLGDARDAEPESPRVAWTSGTLGRDDRAEGVLVVREAVRVRLDAVLDGHAAAADSAALVRLDTGDTLWTFRAADARPAGGAARNRRARAELTLAPGVYRAVARTGRHAFGAWQATPPDVPAAWGLRVRALSGPPTAVGPLDGSDPGLPALAEIRCVGPDETREVRFTLDAPAAVLLVGQGEISTDERYDYATLLHETGGERVVWTMTRASTERAGGASRNRRAEDLRTLDAGTYRLRVVTDGSHDCLDGWDGDEPDDETLWGAVVFALDPATRARPAEAVAVPARPDDVDVLVRLDQTGNGQTRAATFSLDDETRLRVVAAGELLVDDALDAAWIEDGDGKRVWELTRGGSEAAGGAAKNRRFDGTVRLPAGDYTAHVVTNERHAFGDFVDGEPDRPGEWGLRVERER